MHRLCEKSTEVSSPRKRGSIPCKHELDSHFRGNDNIGDVGFHTVWQFGNEVKLDTAKSPGISSLVIVSKSLYISYN
jgi:hypothetical protein